MQKILRRIFIVIMSIALITIFIIGIGVVDNAVKQAQNNPFLNGIFIDTDNYILCLRYLGLKLKIPFGINRVINGTVDFIKPLFISGLIIFTKIKDFFLSLF